MSRRASSIARIGTAAQRLALAGALGVLTAGSFVATGNVTVKAGAAPLEQIQQGSKLAVPVALDFGASTGASVASLASTVSWSASRLTFDSVRTGAFGALTSNTAGAGGGNISISAVAGAPATGSRQPARLPRRGGR